MLLFRVNFDRDLLSLSVAYIAARFELNGVVRDLASREGSGSVSVLLEMVTRVGQRVALTSGFGYCVVEIWYLALFVEKRSGLACDVVLCYAHVLALRSVSLERRRFAP
ncbi:hypothetical protein F511_22433 [Dorcoceras hygrometricum]|uniref:Uncharacterized protein n=1 Tax=Dorcoceras hygrometricum TaxID=472368 RepID=A0A2Z7B5R6_9LAMI|nr:hypothetical protein F511_22433 [Dorcoceras hygrometricum]